jgi:uncharacterized protein (TIGR02145 family)
MNRPTSFLALLLVFLLMGCSPTGSDSDDSPAEEPITSVTDIDGNAYTVVQIGNQTWMAENLKVSRLNDGTPLTFFDFTPDDDDWFFNGASTPMYTWAFTADLNMLHPQELPEDFYGALYSSAAIASGKLAPEGWRVATEADFQALEQFLNSSGEQIASALRSSNGWTGTNGTNTTGMNVLPNGYCTATGSATGAQSIATLGTTTLSGGQRIMINLLPDDPDVLYTPTDLRFGSGIRCIKD